MTTGGLRVLAVVFTAIGGGIGALATHRQIQEGNQKRIEADREYYRKQDPYLKLEDKLKEHGYTPDESVEISEIQVDENGKRYYTVKER